LGELPSSDADSYPDEHADAEYADTDAEYFDTHAYAEAYA
jgi:hypothetical protein